ERDVCTSCFLYCKRRISIVSGEKHRGLHHDAYRNCRDVGSDSFWTAVYLAASPGDPSLATRRCQYAGISRDLLRRGSCRLVDGGSDVALPRTKSSSTGRVNTRWRMSDPTTDTSSGHAASPTSVSWTDRLERIDRRLIYLVVVISLAVPIFVGWSL